MVAFCGYNGAIALRLCFSKLLKVDYTYLKKFYGHLGAAVE